MKNEDKLLIFNKLIHIYFSKIISNQKHLKHEEY